MGRRHIPAIVTLLALSCSPEPSGILDNAGAAPFLHEVDPSALVVDTDTILVGPDRLPDDVLEILFPFSALVSAAADGYPIASVTASVANSAGINVNTGIDLRDDGIDADSLSGDGRYSGIARFSIERVEVGTWNVRVVAHAANGAMSSTILIPVAIVRNNRPPALSDLEADSTVSLSAPDQLSQMMIRAVDPDGKQDLRKVYFESYLPSGQPASGNPFQMFDDGDRFGLSGDGIAGDSVYSIRIQFTGAPQGQYRFEFRAVDRSADTSNVILHQIQVIP